MFSFVDSFFVGFTGSGVFMGPSPVYRAPLCEPESLMDTDRELIFALRQIFRVEEDPRRKQVAAEVRRIILNAGTALPQSHPVKSGS